MATPVDGANSQGEGDSNMRTVVGSLMFVFLSSTALAQNAELTGVILDSSGAAIPDAAIVITHSNTGTKQTTKSNTEGYYTASSLIPGPYEIVVSSEGFQTVHRDGINLQVGQQARVDFSLAPGSSAQSVSVTVDVAAVNSEKVESSVALEPRVLQDLPLQVSGGRRQIDTFTLLVPGATGDGFSHRFNGGSDFSSEVMFNGVPFVFSETQGWLQNVEPPYEAVSEFKMLTSVFSAEYGHGQGVASFNFKSGTNQLHGLGYEFLRNDVFDARGFFASERPINRQNEYGFSVDGPIVVPKLYDGRNRTFFDLSLAWYKFRGAPDTSLFTVPTSLMKHGDFSEYVDGSGSLIPIYDPKSRSPFPNNQIPESRVSAVTSQLLSLIPDPTRPGPVNNITAGVRSLPTNDLAWSFRVDHNLTERQRLSFTSWKDDVDSSYIQGSNLAGPLGGLAASPSIVLAWVANYTYIVNPNLVATLGVSYNSQNNPANNVAKDTSIQIPGEPLGVAYPAMTFTGPADVPAQLGGGMEASNNRKVGLSLINNYLWTVGKHSLNIGWEIRRPYQNNLQWYPAAFGFSNLTTSNPNSPNFASYGNPFASFLLGIADSASFNGPLYSRPRSWYTAGYIQDDWKITRKLTLNLGLRYDVFVPFTEKYDSISYIDLRKENPAAGNIPGALSRLGTCAACVGEHQIAQIRWKYFAPRIGFAYSPNPKTVIRGGYALNYIDGGASEFGTNKVVTGFSNGLTTIANYISKDGGVTPGYGSLDAPGPPLLTPAFNPSAGNDQNVNYLDRYQGQVPYLQNWIVGVQREVQAGIVISASYVGNKVTRMPSGLENLNQLNPSYLSLGNILLADINSPEAAAAGIHSPYPGFAGSVAQALRPYPQYQTITSNFNESGASNYNALQVTAQKRFSKGLEFLVSYTLSRNYSNTSSGFSTFSAQPVNTYNRRAEFSLANSDIPNSLAISGIYELPVGPGKALLNRKGIAGHALGGWQLGWVTRYHSGTPVAITASNVLPLFNGGNRPNLVKGPNPSLTRANFDPATAPIYNINAFSQPSDYSFGDAPRVIGSLRDFPYLNEDVTLAKVFHFSERVDMQFRAEFFNVFNRTIFGGGDTAYSPSNANFGYVGSQANSPRQGQLGLRLRF